MIFLSKFPSLKGRQPHLLWWRGKPRFQSVWPWLGHGGKPLGVLIFWSPATASLAQPALPCPASQTVGLRSSSSGSGSCLSARNKCLFVLWSDLWPPCIGIISTFISLTGYQLAQIFPRSMAPWRKAVQLGLTGPTIREVYSPPPVLINNFTHYLILLSVQMP